MNQVNLPVLLVEDNQDDVFLMRRALKKSALPWSMSVAMDGQEAIDYLSGESKFTDRARFPLPALVLLDLKLPYLNGFDVLDWMRAQPALSEIPVVILTSSPEERDQRKAAEMGAKAYVLKPPAAEALRKIAEDDWEHVGQSEFHEMQKALVSH